jgi:hypothetical protein
VRLSAEFSRGPFRFERPATILTVSLVSVAHTGCPSVPLPDDVLAIWAPRVSLVFSIGAR